MHARTHTPGFTLIELVVVILLVAVLAGLIVPRLISTGEREARAEAEAVAALVGAASRRAALSAQPLALDYDGAALRAMTLRARDPMVFEVGNLFWTPELLLPAVELSHLRLASASADAEALDARGWRIELGGDARPELLINLQDPRGRVWTVLLPPDAGGALLLDAQTQPDPGRMVDLDQSGRGLGAW
jgi:prepilin-type N-terminal cleavage/methylation domain-containing protein